MWLFFTVSRTHSYRTPSIDVTVLNRRVTEQGVGRGQEITTFESTAAVDASVTSVLDALHGSQDRCLHVGNIFALGPMCTVDPNRSTEMGVLLEKAVCSPSWQRCSEAWRVAFVLRRTSDAYSRCLSGPGLPFPTRSIWH